MSTKNDAVLRMVPRAAGFSLLEMLAVIVLIGIVASIVISKVGENVKKGKWNAGKAQLQALGMKVENYALDNGSPPQNLSDLVNRPGNSSNWRGPYAKESELKDPFGHEWSYKSPGEHGDFDIVFYGADGQAGGDGFNADVGNWQ